MASAYLNVFSSEGLEYLLGHPEVAIARDKLGNSKSGNVSFTVPLTDVIRDTLHGQLNLDVSSVSSVPMRWIMGDTAPHIDSGASKFEHSYLVYLNDSEGEFFVADVSYPIMANTAYKFSEGLSHRTQGTGSTPRLLLGPMNELAEPVGRQNGMYYYPTSNDAFHGTNELGSTSSIWTVGQITLPSPGTLNNTQWLIDTNSSSIEITNRVYTNGETVTSDLIYVFYRASAPCFLEGTKILCQVEGVDTYLPVESMRPGTLVKTSLNGYKKVELIGHGKMQNPGHSERIEQRLYKCSPASYPELTEDIYLTGCHSILVSKLTDLERETLVKQLGEIFVTDKKYRLTAFADERAEPWVSEGQHTIWHFALEHENISMNYGVYASGLLVETCCINRLKNKTGFTLIV
jgi:hypothetical protein